MSYLEAILLGLVQGLTEFLPVSSSGHMELTKAIFNQQIKEGLIVSVVLHLATALSTIVIYRRDILAIIRGLFRSERNYVFYIFLSMLPAVIVGLFFEDFIDKLFDNNIVLVGLMLAITGLVLWFSDGVEKGNQKVGGFHALKVGLVQAIAILPGISRSGSTIGALVLMGVKREHATKFSFLMVLPVILGAASKKIIDFSQNTESIDVQNGPLIVGFMIAFLTGLMACQAMIFLVKKTKLRGFAYYCWSVAFLAIITFFIGL